MVTQEYCCPARLGYKWSAPGAVGTGLCKQALWHVPMSWAYHPNCSHAALSRLSSGTWMHLTWWWQWTALQGVKFCLGWTGPTCLTTSECSICKAHMQSLCQQSHMGCRAPSEPCHPRLKLATPTCHQSISRKLARQLELVAAAAAALSVFTSNCCRCLAFREKVRVLSEYGQQQPLADADVFTMGGLALMPRGMSVQLQRDLQGLRRVLDMPRPSMTDASEQAAACWDMCIRWVCRHPNC